MSQITTMTLEKQVAELQAQIELLKQGRTVSTASRLEKIRRDCRDRYFGTREEIIKGQVKFGPKSKSYSDYAALMEIVNKTSGLLYKYSRGKGSKSAAVTNLVETEQDIREYEVICDEVCRGLLKWIDEWTKPEQAFRSIPYLQEKVM